MSHPTAGRIGALRLWHNVVDALVIVLMCASIYGTIGFVFWAVLQFVEAVTP